MFYTSLSDHPNVALSPLISSSLDSAGGVIYSRSSRRRLPAGVARTVVQLAAQLAARGSDSGGLQSNEADSIGT
jgi:hypothetical protein